MIKGKAVIGEIIKRNEWVDQKMLADDLFLEKKRGSIIHRNKNGSIPKGILGVTQTGIYFKNKRAKNSYIKMVDE